MPRPKQRTSDLKQQVLDAAVELLSVSGARALTARGVAATADTSTSAIYELFGDKGGLVREIFFEGFRQLGQALSEVEASNDPRSDLVEMLQRYRRFAGDHPQLAAVMFSRPYLEFDPTQAEAAAAGDARRQVVDRVQRAVDAGVLRGDAVDIALVLVAVAQGLAAAEGAGRFGSSRRSVDRRWQLAIEAIVDGLSMAGAG